MYYPILKLDWIHISWTCLEESPKEIKQTQARQQMKKQKKEDLSGTRLDLLISSTSLCSLNNPTFNLELLMMMDG